jgi:predicted nucleotidyltransferase
MKTKLNADTIKKRIAPVMKKHRVKRAVLFGSSARGTNDSRSDVDVMVVMETAKRFLDRAAEFEDVYDALPGTAIDLLIYNQEELEKIGHRPFIQRILLEGIDLL